MTDNDKKRYFWLKLKKDFFQQHKMKVLKALPNGRLYALIYMELLAESTSHNGKLRFSEMLPYDSVTLAAVIDEDKDNLEKAIDILEQLELLEILSDKTIYLSDIESMIGSETGQTIRKNLAKSVKNTEQLPSDYQKNTLEYRDKSIDIRDKNIEEEKLILESTVDLLNQRSIEAKVINKDEAQEIKEMVLNAYQLTGNIPNPNKLQDIIYKVAEGSTFNPQGYIYNAFKNEGGNI